MEHVESVSDYDEDDFEFDEDNYSSISDSYESNSNANPNVEKVKLELDHILQESYSDGTHHFLKLIKCKSLIKDELVIESNSLNFKVLINFGLQEESLKAKEGKKVILKTIAVKVTPIRLSDKLEISFKAIIEHGLGKSSVEVDLEHQNKTLEGALEHEFTEALLNNSNSRILLSVNAINISERSSKDHVGLVNNGMTCYMNSFLQTLFQLCEIPRQVFSLKTKAGDSSWALAFQCLFYNLLKNKKRPAETKYLTNAFGWNLEDVFTQQDVQEFCCQVLDAFEKRCDLEKKDNFVKELFLGKIMNYIECTNVNYKSNREEIIYDIQLTVQNCKDIYESLDLYTKPEELFGENKYQTDDFGKQDARKGIRFVNFPKILMLHLKRFEFDLQILQNVKILTEYKFEEEIDVSRYLSSDSTQTKEECKYTLLSILVHQGRWAGTGHYFSYARPGLGEQWFQFNDEIVRAVSKEEVWMDCFGGSTVKLTYDSKTLEIGKAKKMLSSHAYMLVYVRNTEINHIMRRIDPAEIPRHIIKESELIEAKEIQELEKSMNRKVHLTSLELFRGLVGVGTLCCKRAINDCELSSFLTNHKDRYATLNLVKFCPIQELLEMMAEHLNTPIGSFFLWYYDKKEDSILPLFSTNDLKEDSTLAELIPTSAPCLIIIESLSAPRTLISKDDTGEMQLKRQSEPLEVYQESYTEFMKNRRVLIALKKFSQGELQFIQPIHITSKSTVGEIIDLVPGEDYLLAQEISSSVIFLPDDREELLAKAMKRPLVSLILYTVEERGLLKDHFKQIASSKIIYLYERESGQQLTIPILMDLPLHSVFKLLADTVYEGKIKKDHIELCIQIDGEISKVRDNDERFTKAEELFSDCNQAQIGYSSLTSAQKSKQFLVNRIFASIDGTVTKEEPINLPKDAGYDELILAVHDEKELFLAKERQSLKEDPCKNFHIT